MMNFDSYRAALLVVLLSLVGGAARAQTPAGTAIITTDGTLAMLTPGDLAPDAVARPTLKLSQPPAPETNASFYDGSHKDLRQSLAWMQETNAQAPTYWNLYTEARIRLQLQDYPGARTTAEQAYQLALKALPASQEYVLLSTAVVAKAHQLAQR